MKFLLGRKNVKPENKIYKEGGLIIIQNVVII